MCFGGPIYNYARELGRCSGVRHVIISEVMRRCDRCRPEFEEARLIVNAELHRLVTGSVVVHVYHYRALSQNWEQYMLRDGVHLNKVGTRRYRRQIRKCVRHYAKKIKTHRLMKCVKIVCVVLSLVLVVVGLFMCHCGCTSIGRLNGKKESKRKVTVAQYGKI